MTGSRRQIRWTAALVLLAAVSGMTVSRSPAAGDGRRPDPAGIPKSRAAVTSPDASVERPNVVLILADDQCWRDFGFLGNDRVRTPHLDRLAAASARYPNGYVPMSVCRPSLATLLTGLYPHQHGIHFNHPPPGLSAMRKMTADEYQACRATTDPLIRRVPTLPRILAAHGYVCLQTGKHWEGSWRTAGFTHGMTEARPADRLGPVTGTRTQANGEWVAHGNGDAGLVIGRETMQPITEFLDAHGGRRPFLVWYAPFLPHTPFDAPQRFRDAYRSTDLPEHLRPYYAEITRFDDTVGQLLGSLATRGLLDRTLIVFCSDNGFRPRKDQFDRHSSRSKLSGYDDGLRTPVLIHWPQQVRPADHPQPVSSVDIVPTILAATGLSEAVPDGLPGRNLMPSARGLRPLTERPVFGAIYPNDARVLGDPWQHVRGRWIRDGDWKLVLPGPDPRPLEAALFDLRTDPRELRNRIRDPDQRDRIRKLTDQLNAWWLPTSD